MWLKMNLFNVFKNCATFLVGVLCTFLFFLFLILSTPIYGYRYLITKLAKFIHPSTLGNPVTSFGNYFACEFLPSSVQNPPRSTIVVTMVVDGRVTLGEGVKLVKEKWFGGSDKQPRYPELQQFVESWMGFLFWKNDPAFQVENHVKSHVLEGSSDLEIEDNLNLFIELLLNKAYDSKRSPWELYFIPNYRNTELEGESVNNNGMTLAILRFHHCLADGFSILYAMAGTLLDTPMSKIFLPNTNNKKRLQSKIADGLTLPLKLFHDIGNLLTTTAFLPSTPWHVPDDKKSWNQVTSRSKPIPMECIKTIKNKLGVSFTGVLLSSVSAGVSKSLHLSYSNGKNVVESLQACTSLPRPSHPDKLRNHLTSTVLRLHTNPNLEPLERLEEVEQSLLAAKRNTMPLIVPFLIKAVGSHFATVSQCLTKNHVVSIGFSNFPGPELLEWEGKRILRAECAGGGLPGVVGVSFAILSFNKYIRIVAAVEGAAMERNGVKKLITFITNEIDTLYELSASKCSHLLNENKVVCV